MFLRFRPRAFQFGQETAATNEPPFRKGTLSKEQPVRHTHVARFDTPNARILTHVSQKPSPYLFGRALLILLPRIKSFCFSQKRPRRRDLRCALVL